MPMKLPLMGPSSAQEIPWAKGESVTLAVYTDAGAIVGTTIRVDASYDDGLTWINGIAMQDPTAAVGAAYLTTVGVGKVGISQDRLFGASKVRLSRTDANAGNSQIWANVTQQ